MARVYFIGQHRSKQILEIPVPLTVIWLRLMIQFWPMRSEEKVFPDLKQNKAKSKHLPPPYTGRKDSSATRCGLEEVMSRKCCSHLANRRAASLQIRQIHWRGEQKNGKNMGPWYYH